MAVRQPEAQHNNAHHQHLVEIVPSLDEGWFHFLHYVFVIQAAAGSRECGCSYEPYPFIVCKIDIFLFA